MIQVSSYLLTFAFSIGATCSLDYMVRGYQKDPDTSRIKIVIGYLPRLLIYAVSDGDYSWPQGVRGPDICDNVLDMFESLHDMVNVQEPLALVVHRRQINAIYTESTDRFKPLYHIENLQVQLSYVLLHFGYVAQELGHFIRLYLIGQI